MTFRVLAAFIAPLLITQGSFEGKLRVRSIDLTLDEPGLNESWLDVAPATAAAREDADVDEAEMQIKNNVVRVENKEDDQEGYGLMDFGRHVMVMVDPAKRKYLEFPLPTGKQAAASRAGAPVVKPLGRTKTINGVNTTGYEVRSKEQILRAWMTKDFPGLTGTFRSFAIKMEDDDDPDDAAMTELMKYGFPVLIITLTDRSVRYDETVSIERATLSADLFKVPAGFTKQTIPGGP
jgi:hypothetical protein